MLPGTDGAYNQLLVVEAGFQYGAHWDFELMESVNFLVGDGEFFLPLFSTYLFERLPSLHFWSTSKYTFPLGSHGVLWLDCGC